MADPFESSRRKLARAQHHILELAKKIDGFITDNPCYRSIDPHPNRPEQYVHKIKLKGTFPKDLSEIAGDAANNLRQALDHATNAVAVAAGTLDPRHAYFPFARTSGDLENTMKGSDLPKEIYPLFRTFKPYKGGNVPLWTLNQIRNRDNHAILIPVVVATGDIASKLKSTGSSLVSMPLEHVWDRAKQEIEIATFRTNAEPDYEIEFTILVAFDQIEGIEGQPPVPFLYLLTNMVEHILLAIEAESRRLGYIT